MSLFKARDWWSTQVGAPGETFDSLSMCMVTLNTAGNSDGHLHHQIVVGGSHGTLAMFNPSFSDGQTEAEAAMLLETQLNEPVIGLETGRFSSGSENVQLAVLHPRRVAVYALLLHGKGESAVQASLTLLYEHKLKRAAYNLIKGTFGGVRNKEFICVQSLDGVLSFFEQESFAFCRFIPNFLLPGPIIYVPSVDAILVAKSDWCLETYRYQSLAMASFVDEKDEGATAGKKLTPDWVFNFGEHVLELRYVELKAAPHILILGERTLLCLSDVGKIRFVKLLNYNPVAIVGYRSDFGDWMISLVVSRCQTLYVYQENALKWATRLNTSPVGISRGNFQGIRGSVVSLTFEGSLICSYLGTDPELYVEKGTVDVPLREMNYEDAEKEMTALQRVIRDSSNAQGAIPLTNKETDLNIKIELSQEIESIAGRFDTEIFDPSGCPGPCISASISLSSAMPLSNVQVVCFIESPMKASWEIQMISTLNDKQTLKVWFYQYEAYIPASLSACIVVSYAGTSGGARVIRKEIRLPFAVVLRPATPFKDADHKITVSTNRAPVDLQALFGEFRYETPSAAVVAFQYVSGEQVSILTSKTSQRYRIQSDSFPALFLLTAEIVRRLQRHFRNDKEFKCFRSCPVPLQELFHEIDSHFGARRQLEKRKDELQQRATQFRGVQKRLLMKFKDKTPSPLANLDAVLEGTYEQIVQAVGVIQKEENMLRLRNIHLSCALRLLLLCLKLEDGGIPDKELEILEAALNPSVNEFQDGKWEENVENALSYFMRVHLGKSAGQEVGQIGQSLQLNDTQKLKKHIVNVIDKLSKGGKIETDLSLNPMTVEREKGKEGSWDMASGPPPSVRLGSARPRSSKKADGIRFQDDFAESQKPLLDTTTTPNPKHTTVTSPRTSSALQETPSQMEEIASSENPDAPQCDESKAEEADMW